MMRFYLLSVLSVFFLMSAKAQNSAFSQNNLFENSSTGAVNSFLYIPWSEVSKNFNENFSTINTSQKISKMNFHFLGQNFVLPEAEVKGVGDFELIQTGPISVIKQKNLDAKIHFSNFEIQTIIHRQIKGIDLNLNLEFACEGFDISLGQIKFAALAKWQKMNQRLDAQIENLSIVIPAEMIQINGLNCSGPQGIDQTIKTQLVSTLSDSTFLSEIVRKYVENQLIQKIQNIQNQLSNGFKINQKSEKIATHLIGLSYANEIGMIFQFKTLNKENIDQGKEAQILSQDALEKIFSTVTDLAHPAWIVDKDHFNQFVFNEFKSNEVNYDLQTNVSFYNLMHSRFLQFFVWPDLMNFNKSAKMNLKTRIKNDKVSILNFDGKSIKFQVQLESWLFGERDNYIWPYIYISTFASGESKIQIENSILSIKTDSLSISNSKSIGEEYKKEFSPSRTISKKILSSVMKSALDDKLFKFKLPQIEMLFLNKKIVYKIHKMKVNGSNFVFTIE